MSFATAHADYLDPDKHGCNEPEDFGHGAILAELKKHCTRRWQWDRVDCCLTGKDADLESTGQQGIELVSVTETHAHIIVHAGITIPGTDVCLNMPPEAEEDDSVYDGVMDVYLNTAQDLVCGAGMSGEWDGDAWYLHAEYPVAVPVLLRKNGELNVVATVRRILKAADKTLKPWYDGCESLSAAVDVLAGWRDDNGPLPEGKPGPWSAWSMYQDRPR